MPKPRRPRLVRIARIQFRRMLARLERIAPAVMLWVPSWGTSILIHAVFVLILALYFYALSRGRGEGVISLTLPNQLTENVESLIPSDHSGDPFTTLKSPEPPSLSIEVPNTPVLAMNQPAIPDLRHFAPEMASPELNGPELIDLSTDLSAKPAPKKGKGSGRVTFALHSESMVAPFSGRQGMAKAQLLRREGGTVRSEKAVDDGLDWIARHQRADGSWSLNFQGQCQSSGCPVQNAIESDTAATGLALLPMLGAGHIHTVKSRYQGHVRMALEWLVAHQDSSGDLFIGGGRNAHMYSHAIATMALCEAGGISGDPALRRPAQRAIDFILAAQALDGG
jgi:hypothetical protein